MGLEVFNISNNSLYFKIFYLYLKISHKYAYIFMIFAIIMANNSNKKKFWHNLTKTFRLVIMTTDSFEERFSTKVSILKIAVFISSFLFVAFLLSFLLLSYSPLNEYVPEKTNSRLQEQLISLSLKTDSLNSLIVSREVYLKNLTGIITGSPLKNNEKINSRRKKQFTNPSC